MFIHLEKYFCSWFDQANRFVLQNLYVGRSPPSWWPLDTFSSKTLDTREDCQMLLIAMRKYYGVDLELEDWVVWIMLWLSRMMRSIVQTSETWDFIICMFSIMSVQNSQWKAPDLHCFCAQSVHATNATWFAETMLPLPAGSAAHQHHVMVPNLWGIALRCWQSLHWMQWTQTGSAMHMPIVFCCWGIALHMWWVKVDSRQDADWVNEWMIIAYFISVHSEHSSPRPALCTAKAQL